MLNRRRFLSFLGLGAAAAASGAALATTPRAPCKPPLYLASAPDYVPEIVPEPAGMPAPVFLFHAEGPMVIGQPVFYGDDATVRACGPNEAALGTLVDFAPSGAAWVKLGA